jgi:hypothetical protein
LLLYTDGRATTCVEVRSGKGGERRKKPPFASTVTHVMREQRAGRHAQKTGCRRRRVLTCTRAHTYTHTHASIDDPRQCCWLWRVKNLSRYLFVVVDRPATTVRRRLQARTALASDTAAATSSVRTSCIASQMSAAAAGHYFGASYASTTTPMQRTLTRREIDDVPRMARGSRRLV